MTKDEAIRLRRIIEQAAQSLDDKTALEAVCLHPHWAVGAAYCSGFKVRHDDRLFRCVQAHTSMDGWQPENTPALWEEINETHTGELNDPIPYNGNMALTAGLYYIQDGVVYLCIRDTINPVHSPLAELTELYVEAVE
jgi:hypothetical protein